VKTSKSTILGYQLLVQSRDAEIEWLRLKCEGYRAALNITSSQAERIMREQLAAVMLERDSLREQLARQTQRPESEGFLNFKVILAAATTFEADEYANWVRDHREQLAAGFKASGETDEAVYARVQYSRAMGLGV